MKGRARIIDVGGILDFLRRFEQQSVVLEKGSALRLRGRLDEIGQALQFLGEFVGGFAASSGVAPSMTTRAIFCRCRNSRLKAIWR